MRLTACISALALATLAHDVQAYEFRSRFVRRIGDVDYPIQNQLNLEIHPDGYWPDARIRVQFGVFDDAEGVAPNGGFIGWTAGTINITSGFTGDRTPGRLWPFTFAPPQSNGQPAADPFTSLFLVEPILGDQVHFWPAGSDPDAPPPPVIRGRNAWVSVYEFTINPLQQSYADSFVSITGGLYAAREWRIFQSSPPTEDEDGIVTYLPFPMGPVAFSNQIRILNVPVPGPQAGASIVMLLTFVGARRERRSN
jgi:hypothetical protein